MTSNFGQFSTVSNIYTLPFRSSVWISCLILVVVSPILLFLTSKADLATSNEEIHGFNGSKINQQKRFSDSVMSTIAAIVSFVVFIYFSMLYNLNDRMMMMTKETLKLMTLPFSVKWILHCNQMLRLAKL
jgi:hypothetical protein